MSHKGLPSTLSISSPPLAPGGGGGAAFLTAFSAAPAEAAAVAEIIEKVKGSLGNLGVSPRLQR